MIRAYLRHLFASDDPAPMWSAAIALVSVSMGAGLVFTLSAVLDAL